MVHFRQVLQMLRGLLSLKCRSRRGFTLIETTVSISIASILVAGTAILVATLQERLDIEFDLQLAREWGNNYVDSFTRDIRNGVNHDFRREAAPSNFSVDVVKREDMSGPDDEVNLAIAPDTVRMTYLYDYGLNLPIYQKDRRNFYDSDFPESGDPRSEFYVVPNTFKIDYKRVGDRRWPNDRISRDLGKDYITISFQLRYTRMPILDILNMRPYVKYLKFYGSAYVINENWPVEETAYGG